MDNIKIIFKEKNLKLTPQRLAVYNYLKGTTAHPCADTIYKAIHELYPTMSLATVYKTLKTLAEVKLIQEINVGEYNFRYDGNPNPHPHIQCLSCGKVDDLNNITFSELNKIAEDNSDYEIVYNQVYFYGYCNSCKSDNKKL